MSRLTCESCAAFFPDAGPLPGAVIDVAAGEQPASAGAQCRRSVPPWATVKPTDWCMAWTRGREPLQRQDDGA